MTPPAAAQCLNRPYSSKPEQKGGTLIDERVKDLEEHRRRLADPDYYRPPVCASCGHHTLHAHDFRERRIRGDEDTSCESFRRYQCQSCCGVWLVLAAFMARYLHRSWRVVQSAAVAAGELEETGAERRVSVKSRTLRRWIGRLRSSAAVLLHAFAESGLKLAGLIRATRAELVDELARRGLVTAVHKLADVAGWIHRLVPGLRLM